MVLDKFLVWIGKFKKKKRTGGGSHLQHSGGFWGWGGVGCRAHSNPNPSTQKCRMEEGKPYTIHHKARLHREESSMATSHLKSGQIQQ